LASKSGNGYGIYSSNSTHDDEAGPSIPLLVDRREEGIDSFFNIVREERMKLNDLKEYLEIMRNIHSQLLTSHGAQPELNAELSSAVEKFKASSRNISDTVKRYNSECERSAPYGTASTRIMKNQVMTINLALKKSTN